MGREIKFNGRELAIMRAIGFGLGISGTELRERTSLSPEDFVDVANTLLDMGYVETASMKEHITLDDYAKEDFEVNPSYSTDIREALKRR